MDTTTAHRTPAIAAAVDCIRLMADGTLDDFRQVIHAEGINREASHEPPACRTPGPAGFHATARWLRSTFPDLGFEIHTVVADGDVIAVHNVMRGTQAAPMAFYTNEGEIADVFPSRGRSMTMSQSHWLRVVDGLVIEHWANRDDLGMAKQLGWVPPTPPYLVKMKRARRRAARDLRTGRSG